MMKEKRKRKKERKRKGNCLTGSSTPNPRDPNCKANPGKVELFGKITGESTFSFEF